MWITKTKHMLPRLFLLICLYLTTIFTLLAQNNNQIALANEYYKQGEMDKAITLYDELAKDARNIPFIHNNYLEILISKKEVKAAKNYLQRAQKTYPSNVRYDVELIDLYFSVGDSATAENYFEELATKVSQQLGLLRNAAQYLMSKQHNAYAEELYLRARDIMRDPTAYALQMGTLYRFMNEKDKMIREYLIFAQENPGNARYVKNILQNTLDAEEDLNSFIALLMERIQSDPDNQLYADFLIWANLQTKNFYGAFIQARAIDKRANLNGQNSMEIGHVAFENEAYDVAQRIFKYITENFKDSRNYIYAKQMLIKCKEQLIKNSFPVDSADIRNLVEEYNSLIAEIGLSNYTLDAYREKALLQAFYLNERPEAIEVLKEIIAFPNAEKEVVGKAKLDLGDIYILENMPWESVLLYYQVEKTQKNEELGQLAKLKNAKLSFYKGDFSLAQEHLDILKKTTRREIANDAMDLSILIKNNTILDSTQAALNIYAKTDLLLYQNKKLQALDTLNKMLEQYKEHPIEDEVLWLKANIKKQLGDYDEAITILDRIVNELPYDILTDDALFEMGLIYEEQLQDLEKAKALYQQLLIDYPGSLFVAEARKRFRKLRGDFIN